MKKLLILFFLLTNQCSANFFYTPNWLQIRWWALQAKKCADEPNVDTPDQIQKTEFQFASAAEKAVWTSLALQKIGYFCPITHNPDNERFKKTLITFQRYHKTTRQDGVICAHTVDQLNSIIIQKEAKNPELKDIMPPPLPVKK